VVTFGRGCGAVLGLLSLGSKADLHRSPGVLLLDPTMKEGTPLWYGYRNWEATPGIDADTNTPGPTRDSIFNDFIYWAQRLETFNPSPLKNPAANTHIPIQALLHLICAEWLTIGDYIRTRLGQIEWEISFPEHFLNEGSEIDDALKKLHVWRRLVPLYREMLTETLQRVFHFPCHTEGVDSITTSNPSVSTFSGSGMGTGVGTGGIQPSAASASTSPAPPKSIDCPCATHRRAEPVKKGPVNAFSDDFNRALSYMEEYQKRIERLTSVVTAIISIDDSRRSQDDNRNVARLTWLATFFIPLSFIASLLSMQDDVGKLRDTVKFYFEVAMPLAVGSLILAFILASPIIPRTWRRVKKWTKNTWASLWTREEKHR
jgi:hypothetical protein